MTPSNDLLDTVARHRWRLDCRRHPSTLFEQWGWRCMYWCEECGLWRCVEDSGAYRATPRLAIEAAVAQETKEPEERPVGREGQALP